MSRDEQYQDAYALVGETLSTCTQIELELLYIGQELTENAQSVTHMWYQMRSFGQRIDLVDLVFELTHAKNETRNFWIRLRKILLDLNSLRNHLAHGAVVDDPESDISQPHVMKFYENRSAKLVSQDDLIALRELMHEALSVCRWFHEFLDRYGSAAELKKEDFRLAAIKKKAKALKDKQAKDVPGEQLAKRLRDRQMAAAEEEGEDEPLGATRRLIG